MSGWSTGRAFVGVGGRSEGSAPAGSADFGKAEDDDEAAAFDDPMFQNTMMREIRVRTC